MTDRLRMVLATPLDEELCRLVEQNEPRVELIRDHTLLPPQLQAGDHYGDPNWTRDPEGQAKFEALLLGADALYGIPDLSPELLARVVRGNPRLRWVQAMAAGAASQLERAGLTAPEVANVQFTTSAGVHARPLAEFAAFGVLAGAKELPRMLEDKHARRWTPRRFLGQLCEQRVAVAGLGAIGTEAAKMLVALGATVVGVNRTRREDPHLSEVYGLDEIRRAVAGCSALVIALPGHASTDRLVDAGVLAALRGGATVVNVGRGSVVDEAALIDALRSEQIGFAALDVTETEPLPEQSPLWDLPNVLISPHTAALSRLEDRRIAELVAENAGLFLDGAPLRNVIPADQFIV